MPDDIKTGAMESISRDFIPRGGSNDGADPWASLSPDPEPRRRRGLTASEISLLVKGGNTAEDWDLVLVTDPFDPSLVSNVEFFGKVVIGAMERGWIGHHDMRIPVGIRDSTIMNCRLGDGVAVRDVRYLANFDIGDRCILLNIGEMHCTNHAKFGNGILKEGEDESVRVWIELRNENGGRSILPFEGLIPADAWIWSSFRDDARLMDSFKRMTGAVLSDKRGYHGRVGERTVIKDCRIIKDALFGERAYVKGANKIKNCTILSTADEPTQIGEGVELVNGIVGHGNRIFYEAKAIRFVTGRNCQLKYGARLLNSVLGDNSTVSCCELLNNLIFPFHEQHHNNSFLIASMIGGQSNIAAGATIGSNHNSRAPDGEIVAGRGFWPGLSASFKHNSRFASFCLVAKGSYERELDIPYPFALVSRRGGDEAVRVFPAWWFIHDMYAMARNSWKFGARDGRKVKVQHIETDYLAPDTVQEMLAAMERLQAIAASTGRPPLQDSTVPDEPLRDGGLQKGTGGWVEKPARGWAAYRDFCLYFSLKTLVEFLGLDASSPLSRLMAGAAELAPDLPAKDWVNCGGQVMALSDVDALRARVVSGQISTWDGMHAAYDEIQAAYPRRKARYAVLVLEILLGTPLPAITEAKWRECLDRVRMTVRGMAKAAWDSRRKDYEDPYRRMVYSNAAEMEAVLGRLEDNSFLKDLQRRSDEFCLVLDSLAATE